MPQTGAPAEPQGEGTPRRPALPALPRWALTGGLAVVLVACLGAALAQILGGDDSGTTAGWAEGQPSSRPSAAVQAGPRASRTPVRVSDDLSRVCEGWYYPASPRYSGRGPHPISIGVSDQPEPVTHRIKAALDVPHNLGADTREAWMPSDPAKSELVACLTLTRTTDVVKTCGKVTLKRGVHALAVYEVATGRKLAQRQINGDVVRCPNVIPLGSGDTIATTVSDRYLYLLLNEYVTK
ncbi:hypothetical protein [Actinoplanes sp. URMC 104]|uniref:hypothetical protein n=1 Tax=Actinoplanes sp. URMC 104 TaxID=3423409 RepID=UPI003F1BBD47